MSINILVVDDSALVRKVLSEIIAKESDFNLVGTAHDPIFAIEKIKKNNIDVIMLDIEMPRMDGLTFLEKLMRVRPTPVIILSSLTQKNAAITLHAFESGAFGGPEPGLGGNFGAGGKLDRLGGPPFDGAFGGPPVPGLFGGPFPGALGGPPTVGDVIVAGA